MSIDKESLINVIHDIVNYEYLKYKKSKNIDKVLLEESELFKILKKYGNEIGLLKYLVQEGLIIEYVINNVKKYRSIYFDVIQDYVGIKESKLGKPTVFEYKILKPRLEKLPLFNIKCDEVYEEAWHIVSRYLPKDIDNKLYQTIQQVLRGVACLRERYSNMQKESILLSLNKIFKRAGESVIISAPTGWGKTEAFIIPIIIYSIIQKILGVNGVKAILVYPRKALASNQVKRIIEYYIKLIDWIKTNVKIHKIEAMDLLPLISIRDGQSKSPSDYKKGDKFRIHTVKIKVKEKQSQNSKIERIKYNVLINDYYSVILKPENQVNRLKTYLLPITNVYFEVLDHDMIPDIIVTNLDTFNRMLSTPRFNIIWKKPESLGCIVFDEAHVYDKTNLLHLIYILQRTRSLIKQLTHRLLKSNTFNQPLMVFSSATLHKEFENIIKNVFGEGKTVYRITHEGSEDPKHSKLELVTIIAPRPNVAGQWIAQLIGIYNVALSLSKAIRSGAIYNNTPIPYKAILFVDSLHYLRSIKRFISDILIKRLGNILKEHSLEITKDPNDRDYWSFIDDEVVRFVQEYLDSIKKDLVRAHWADLQQEIREKIEEDFNEKTFPTLLVSTSTLELGIDIPDIWSIIQFRPPLRSDSFIQRIGRAGRSDKTYRTALGTLILTNQPTDIAYLIDDNKSNELFHILPPKMPKNLVITKQHILLSIADFLNIKSITGELNAAERAVINMLFYEPGDDEPNIEQAAKIYAKLIMKYRNEIANYIENVSEDFKELRYRVIDKILADLAKIYRPSGIKEALVKSVNIKEIAKEAEKIKEQVNKINDSKSKILNELSIMVRKMPTNNQILECFNTFRDLLIEKLSFSDLNKILDYLSMLEVIVITGKAEDLEEIYEEKVDDIESYSRIIGDIIDVMNETDCKIDLNEMKSNLIELRHRLIELANKIRNCNELRDYVESTQRLSQYIGVTNTLLSLLGMYTRDGMYYTSLMTQPVKQVEVKYLSGTRTEPVFLALSRIASLTVDKLIEGEQLD